MRASRPGVPKTGLLILSVILVGCTSPGPAQTSATGTAAPPIVTSSSSPPVLAQTSASCASQEGVPPKGTFSEVQGWIAYRCGSLIVAVDPAHPHHPLSIGSSNGADPIGWSQDGTRLLLLGAVPGSCCSLFIFVLDADGSWTRLFNGAFWGSFSPDGNRVAYGSAGDVPGPYVIDADGGIPRSLGPPCSLCGEQLPESAAWSPDASPIAFIDFTEDSSTYGNHAYGVSFVNADGTGLKELLVHLPWGGAGGIAWSPDGSRLVLSMHSEGHNPRGRIYVVDADGSGLTRITRDGNNRWPAWSPDGSRIAFVRGHRLFTMAADGSDMRRVEGVEPDGPIAWNPAG